MDRWHFNGLLVAAILVTEPLISLAENLVRPAKTKCEENHIWLKVFDVFALISGGAEAASRIRETLP